MEYVWKVEKMMCYPMLDGNANVVFNVDWSITGKDQDKEAKMTGTQYVDFVAAKNFVAYDQLTEDRVLEWVFSAMGGEAIQFLKEEVDKAVKMKSEPTVVAKSLPWA